MVEAQSAAVPVNGDDANPELSSNGMSNYTSHAETRAMITRLAVLIDDWVQNCEEKVNLTKAAYDSASLLSLGTFV